MGNKDFQVYQGLDRQVSTFSGTITGSGQFSVADSTLILTGANTYTGGTFVANATFQLGNGGTAGSVVGNIGSNGGLVVFNRSDAVTFSGVISGTGAVMQQGPGTLILTADNSYTGGTTIAAGTLQLGNGGTTGSVAGNITDNAALVFNRSGAVSFGGVISGTGSLTQAGSGTLTLVANNSYTGGTTISSGTLVVGNGATAGSITGNVTDNAALTFNRSDTITFGGVISGTGSLTKTGAGTLILSGANTYGGGTTISSGAVQIGNGGTTGSVAGNIANNAALAFNRSDNATFANVISGTGSLTKLGAGTLTLSGANIFSGATTVAAGSLSVTGSISNSSVSVANGATLAGTGTVGPTAIQSGGTLASGNSIGTLTVNGNLSFAPGAIYSVEVSPSAADRTIASGTASLNGTVATSIASGTYAFGQRFAILTATGGVSGTFASLTGIPSALKGQLSYDATNVYLDLSPNALAPLVTGTTGNQHAIIGAIDAAVAAGTVPSAGFVTLYTLSGPSLNSALDQISGQAAPNVANAVGQGFLSFMSMTAGGGSGDAGSFAPGSAYGKADAPHRAQLGRGETRVWGAAYGGHVGLSGNSASGAASLSSNNVGMIGGADIKLADNLLAGATLGWGRQMFHSGNGSGDSDDFMLGLYGRADAGAGYLAASFGVGWHQITTQRVVTVSGTDVLQGKQDAEDYGGRIEAGWRLAVDSTTSLIPYGAFAGESFDSPAYAETALSGASTFALSYGAHTTALGRSELGARLSRFYGLDQASLTAELHAAWAHQLDDQPFIQASFQNLAGTSFQVAGVRPGRDTALLGLDLEVRNSSGLFFGVKGEGQFGAGTTIVEGLGNFGWRW